jgi:hypothetical protein
LLHSLRYVLMNISNKCIKATIVSKKNLIYGKINGMASALYALTVVSGSAASGTASDVGKGLLRSDRSDQKRWQSSFGRALTDA